MAEQLRTVVVVGASLAGLRAAESVRATGFTGRLVMIDAEEHRPYNRPPLSKQLLKDGWEAERVHFKGTDALGADWRLGESAVALDTGRHTLALRSGESLAYDRLILATGTRARWPPALPRAAGMYALRTLDDALALRERLATARRLVVIGAGFVGCEVAAVARQLGLPTTLVDIAAAPLSAALGDEPATLLAGLHREHGVRLCFGQPVRRVHTDAGRFRGVRLADGTEIEADVAVVGAGARPVTDWLEGSGLRIDDGVLCDAHLRAVGAEDVYAAGDVLRWPHPVYGSRLTRVEHWTNAALSGMTAGHNALHDEQRPFDALPEFWSDQYDVNVRGIGLTGGGRDFRVIEGSTAERSFVGVYTDPETGGRTGALAFNATRSLARLRGELARGARPPAARPA